MKKETEGPGSQNNFEREQQRGSISWFQILHTFTAAAKMV